MRTVIDELRQRRRKKSFEKWIFRAILAEAFFVALSPSLATVALLGGIVLMILRLITLKDSRVFRSLPFDVPLALFCVLGAVSVVASPDMAFSFYNYYNLAGVYALTYLLFGQNVKTAAEIKKIVAALGLSAVLVVLYGFFQYVFGVDTTSMRWVDGEAFPELTTRIYSTWENPNIFAGYLDILALVLLGFLLKSRDKFQKTVLAAAILTVSVCLIMTYARGAMLTLVIVLVACGITEERRILPICFVAAVTALVADSTLYERLLSVFSAADSSSALRFALWESTLAMIGDHPFFGIGWGAYFMVYPQYDYYLQNSAVTIYHAHNLYLNYAAEIGIAGAAAFCWYFFGTMRLALTAKFLPEDKEPPAEFFTLPSFAAADNDDKIVSIADKLGVKDEEPADATKEEPTKEQSEKNETKKTEETTETKEETPTKEQKKETAEEGNDEKETDEEPATKTEKQEADTGKTAKAEEEKTTDGKTKEEEKADEEPSQKTEKQEADTSKTAKAEEEKAPDGEPKKKEKADGNEIKKDDTAKENKTDGEAETAAEEGKTKETLALKAADGENLIDKKKPEENDGKEMPADDAPLELSLSEAVAASLAQKESKKTAKDKDEKEKATSAATKLDAEAKETEATDKNEMTPAHTESDGEETVDDVPLTWHERLNNFLTWDDERVLAGFTFGIGLAFVSVALNGITDDLLFNIPSSILLWLLAALAAVMAETAKNDTVGDSEGEQ